jgi:hypothetical protein
MAGNLLDTLAKQPLQNATLMAIKFRDSTLLSFSKSNKEGILKPFSIPLDTYLVIISHPLFADKTYFIAPSNKDTSFTFKNIILPSKTIELKEVEIIAGKDKSYYKGDTLIFTADSFKTKANATVEDLLKKLPGFRVDAEGKITVQGKKVDQVLVDGDEFFGSDPTIATRNLNAASLENVQVYEKQAENSGDGKDETVKVVNLQLKDDAKKGYFGKVSGASDFNKFYENDFLFNKFRKNRKISLFGLAANTPKQGFSWNDANKYGLDNETPYSYDESNDSWSNNQTERTGLPQIFKSGVYYSDKFGKKTKINGDYTYNQNGLQSQTETNTQFFLKDTSYSNLQTITKTNNNQTQNFNYKLVQKLDSLTELIIIPKADYNINNNKNLQVDDFTSENNILTRSTQIQNENKIQTTNVKAQIKINRKFYKKDRVLNINYQPNYNESNASTTLGTNYYYFLNQESNLRQLQKKSQHEYKTEHTASIIFTEPLTKKYKVEFNYTFYNLSSINNRTTFDSTATGFDLYNPLQSNNFINKNYINKGGLKFIYDVKKYKISAGSLIRNVNQTNTNLSNNQTTKINVNNLIPSAQFVWRYNQATNLSINYNGNANQPNLQQLQPVIDNSDPNRISIGNPNLKPSFSNYGNINFYTYKAISDKNFYFGSNFGNTLNQISNTITFDSLGKAISKPINVNGNYYGNFYMGAGIPIFKRFMKIYYSMEGNFNNNVSIINELENVAQNFNIGPNLTLEKQSEKFEVSLSGNYNYAVAKTNVSSNISQPYYTYGFNGNILIKLPKKFVISTDGNYTNNGNRTNGYNLNYFIWNASLAKTFLKNQNFILSLNANDILNQNISNNRFNTANQIVDTKTQIIKRYFLIKALYKINSQKTKEEEEDND